METYPRAAVERAMKIQEVILRAAAILKMPVRSERVESVSATLVASYIPRKTCDACQPDGRAAVRIARNGIRIRRQLGSHSFAMVFSS
jgi:hypothetical protein